MTKYFHTLARGQSGAVVVEFALLLTFLLLIAAGIFEFGRAFWYYDALAKATRDGARYMSMAPKATISSAGVPVARNLVVAAANAASLSPALTSGEVLVTCLPGSCSDGTAPVDVEVQISGYVIEIGGIFPFILNSLVATKYTGVSLAPHTTMRYMKD